MVRSFRRYLTISISGQASFMPPINASARTLLLLGSFVPATKTKIFMGSAYQMRMFFVDSFLARPESHRGVYRSQACPEHPNEKRKTCKRINDFSGASIHFHFPCAMNFPPCYTFFLCAAVRLCCSINFLNSENHCFFSHSCWLLLLRKSLPQKLDPPGAGQYLV